jgi:hypothetical protein
MPTSLEARALAAGAAVAAALARDPELAEQFAALLDVSRIDDRSFTQLPLYDELVAYRDRGAPVGGFLTALLSNDLADTYAYADDMNRPLIPLYVAFLRREFPSSAWRTPGRVERWVGEWRERQSGHPWSSHNLSRDAMLFGGES